MSRLLSHTRSSNGGGPSGEAAIEQLKRFLLGVIDEEAVHQVQKAVAGGAFDGPFGSQRLVAGQDLLGHDIEGPIARFRYRAVSSLGVPVGSRAPGFAGVLQEAEIFLRLEKPVRMIHAQPANVALTHQIENQRMHRGEDFGIFHANGGEIVDVEEAAVVDLVHRDAPEAEAIGFAFQQPLQAVEAAGLTAPAVDFDQRGVDGFRGLRAGLQQARQPALDDLLLPLALADLGIVGFGVAGQMAQSGNDAFQFRNVLVVGAQLLAQLAPRPVPGSWSRCAAPAAAGVS